MPLHLLRGGEALAYGALVSGVELATSYPGSPSSEVVDALIGLTAEYALQVEWASNERVALETAIGVSIAGRRALVCTKSVGMNVMLDPMMALNLTPVHGGLVIILGDDPGGYGSQNDQDTRLLAPLLEMPMLEPATPGEAFAMMLDAFALSERFQMPVIVRETRSFSQTAGPVDIPAGPYERVNRGLVRETWRFVPVPRNVVAKHRALHERLADYSEWAETSPYLEMSGTGDWGILAAGFAAQKLIDVLGQSAGDRLSICRLGALYPLPEKVLGRWLSGCREVLVVEENEPFIERALHAIAHTRAPRTRILGKLTGHFRAEGELFRWQIREALHAWQPEIEVFHRFRPQDESAEHPQRENYCEGSRFDVVLDAVVEVARAAGEEPILVGDPGCLARVADRLDAKYALGSAIGIAHGLIKGGAGERAVALFGDSAFFHSAVPALFQAVVSKSSILMIVLDNQAARTSGNQPHPGVGRDALGRPAPKLSIERIARACDVAHLRTVRLGDPPTELHQALRDFWAQSGPAMIVVEIPTV